MLGVLLTATTLALAQLAAQVTFEAASVKSAGPYREGRSVGMHGGPGTEDPGQIHWHYVSMRRLLMEAYGLKEFQVDTPPWIGKEFYDVDATVPAGAGRDQFRLMLQTLLAERFHLKAHLENQKGQAYELVVARNGPKLKPSTPVDTNAKPTSDEPIGPNGRPTLQRARDGVVELPSAMQGKGHLALKTFQGAEIRVRHEGLEYLVERLMGELERPVIDQTGITGQFDYTLTYLPPSMATATVPDTGLSGAPEPRRPDLSSALQAQLGLKLEARNLPTEVLVVERLEKVPTEN
jgi:uncharacterized protein (TIGR03435 family)